MCLSPICFLAKEIENIFKINSKLFFDNIQDLSTCSNTQIKISVISNPEKGIRNLNARWIVDTQHIEINECLLCAVWCASYFIANVYGSLNEYLNEKNKELVIERDSLNLVEYGKSLVPSFAEWPNDIPQPKDFKSNKYAESANLIMPIATDMIICHELAHMFLKHCIEGGVQQEIEADNLAVSWILNQEREKFPLKELAVLSAFITLIFIDANADKDGERHPSSFERMNNYLEGLKIEDNDILWLLAILSYRAWEKSFNGFSQDVNFEKKPFKYIFKSLILSL